MQNPVLIDHPLVQHKLTLMHRKSASTNSFRRLLTEISTLMAYEALRDLPNHEVHIETPVETTTGPVVDAKKLVFVSIMRAQTGILNGMLTVVPGARVGHIGLYRDANTHVAVENHFKMPGGLHERDATSWWSTPCRPPANSAAAGADRLKEHVPRSMKFVCLLTCPGHVPTCRSSPPPWTGSSTSTATSCPAWVTPVTVPSGRSIRGIRVS